MDLPTKNLQDTLTLVAGAFIFLTGLEIFADPVRRKYPSEALKATASLLFGLFLFGFWFTFLRLSNNDGSSNATYNNLY